MPPKKKKNIPAPLVSSIESRGLGGLPTELFDEICGYIKPVDVLNVGCANKRLAFLTTPESRIWTIHYQSAALPPIPDTISDIVHTKKVLTLISRNSTEADRRVQQIAIIEQRREDIISRYTAMTPPIPQDILQYCSGFTKAWDSPVPLTNRIFTNITRALGPDIKRLRIDRISRERYLELHNTAMEGIPLQWSRYMSIYGVTYKTGNSREENEFISKCVSMIADQLKDFKWSDAFPDFDPSPYLDEARKLLRAPYEKCVKAKADLVSRYPHLVPVLESLNDSMCYFFQKPDTKESDLELWVEEMVLKVRLKNIFPRYSLMEQRNPVQIYTFGGTEWYNQNKDAFDYKQDKWNYEEMTDSWAEYRKTLNERVASMYRHIIEICSPEIFEACIYYDDLEGLIQDVEESSEWPLLNDLDPVHVVLMRRYLSDISRHSYYVGDYDFYGMGKSTKLAQSMLTVPSSEFDEPKFWTLCEQHFNQTCLTEHSKCGAIEQTYYTYRGMDFRTGFTLDEAGKEDLENWMDVIIERLDDLAAELEETRVDYLHDCFKQQLLREVQGVRGTQKTFVTARALLEEVLPTKLDFDPAECLEKYANYLNEMADEVERDPYDSEEDFYRGESESGSESDRPDCVLM
ncbi:hypothetical protein HDU79_011450 [Rhizoclosmatium sp. JEL0117]|nr:hypothetical protein HDU79_011450 [Rhizoclosmatium sp. JEL0117]